MVATKNPKNTLCIQFYDRSSPTSRNADSSDKHTSIQVPIYSHHTSVNYSPFVTFVNATHFSHKCQRMTQQYRFHNMSFYYKIIHDKCRTEAYEQFVSYKTLNYIYSSAYFYLLLSIPLLFLTVKYSSFRATSH